MLAIGCPLVIAAPQLPPGPIHQIPDPIRQLLMGYLNPPELIAYGRLAVSFRASLVHCEEYLAATSPDGIRVTLCGAPHWRRMSLVAHDAEFWTQIQAITWAHPASFEQGLLSHLPLAFWREQIHSPIPGELSYLTELNNLVACRIDSLAKEHPNRLRDLWFSFAQHHFLVYQAADQASAEALQLSAPAMPTRNGQAGRQAIRSHWYQPGRVAFQDSGLISAWIAIRQATQELLAQCPQDTIKPYQLPASDPDLRWEQSWRDDQNGQANHHWDTQVMQMRSRLCQQALAAVSHVDLAARRPADVGQLIFRTVECGAILLALEQAPVNSAVMVQQMKQTEWRFAVFGESPAFRSQADFHSFCSRHFPSSTASASSSSGAGILNYVQAWLGLIERLLPKTP